MSEDSTTDESGPRVLVVGDAHDQAGLDALMRDLEELGAVATLVWTPGEVLWNLEAKPFVMVVMHIDRELTDRMELLAFLRDSHPLLRRVVVVQDAGRVLVDDACTVVEQSERRAMLAALLGR